MKNFLTNFAVSSSSNSKMKKLLITHNINKMIRFTNHGFIRIYPNITHIFSSNYNPIDFWIAGI